MGGIIKSTPDPNGVYRNGEYFNPGTGTWADLTSGWSAFTDWSQGPTDLVYAKTFDFGTKKPAIPTVAINTLKGNAKLQLKFGNSIDGDNHVVTPYVSNQTMSLYCDLDYYVSGYIAQDNTYSGQTARYAEVIVTVAARDSAGANVTAVLSDVLAEFDQRLEHEYFLDVNTTDLAGSVAGRTIPVQKLSLPVAGITYGTLYQNGTSNAFGKYTIHTLNKSTPSFVVFDLDRFQDNTGVDHDGIDIDVIGFPILTTTEGGGTGRA